MSLEELDYNLILEGCGVQNAPIDVVIQNITNLEDNYDSDVLIRIYNHFLISLKDPELLVAIVKLLDKYRKLSTLPILTNFHLMWRFSC